jgi:integrase
MPKTLTVAAIKALRPGPQRMEIKDSSPALYVIVQPTTGFKSFAMRFRGPNGKPSKLVLGAFDPSGEAEGDVVLGAPMTLAGARKLCAELLREKARGKDIVADRKKAKSTPTNTFAQCALDYIEAVRPRTRDWQRSARLLGVADGSITKGSLSDVWSTRPVAEISSDDLHTLIQKARLSGVPGVSSRVGQSENRASGLHSVLSRFFGWCHRDRRITSNPMKDLFKPQTPGSRDKVLTPAEISLIWRSCTGKFGDIVRLLLLTGSRLREISEMRWGEIDGDMPTNMMWTLPAGRSKNRRQHKVPLTAAMQEILDRQDRSGPYVFPSTVGKPLAGFSVLKARLDEASGVTGWRLHDCRRSWATHVAELGVRSDVIEAALNHISGSRSGVAGIYNRSELLNERRAALSIWSSYIEGLVTERVVPLRQRA